MNPDETYTKTNIEKKLNESFENGLKSFKKETLTKLSINPVCLFQRGFDPLMRFIAANISNLLVQGA